MTRCYVDANFLYDRLRPAKSPTLLAQRARWETQVEIESEGEKLLASGLVVDEVAYRLALGWLHDDCVHDPLSAFRADERSAMARVADRLTRVFEEVNASVDFITTDRSVVERAQRLMVDPGLAPRDAFHAAHALEGGCEVIVTADRAFNSVPGLRRLGP